jgi:hypothetical protein
MVVALTNLHQTTVLIHQGLIHFFSIAGQVCCILGGIGSLLESWQGLLVFALNMYGLYAVIAYFYCTGGSSCWQEFYLIVGILNFFFLGLASAFILSTNENARLVCRTLFSLRAIRQGFLSVCVFGMSVTGLAVEVTWYHHKLLAAAAAAAIPGLTWLSLSIVYFLLLVAICIAKIHYYFQRQNYSACAISVVNMLRASENSFILTVIVALFADANWHR